VHLIGQLVVVRQFSGLEPPRRLGWHRVIDGVLSGDPLSAALSREIAPTSCGENSTVATLASE
jgi:hypothetical protein